MPKCFGLQVCKRNGTVDRQMRSLGELLCWTKASLRDTAEPTEDLGLVEVRDPNTSKGGTLAHKPTNLYPPLTCIALGQVSVDPTPDNLGPSSASPSARRLEVSCQNRTSHLGGLKMAYECSLNIG